MNIPDTDGRDRAQRWSELLGLLGDRGRLSVAEAALTLAVSEATIRRDFAALADQQLATRTHGGVVATGMAYDLPTRYRGRSDPDRGQAERKERIAAAAAALLEPGTVVGFNGGFYQQGAGVLGFFQHVSGDFTLNQFVVGKFFPPRLAEQLRCIGRTGRLEGRAEIIVGKQRNGPTGFVNLYFNKTYTRFENLSPRLATQ